jgi:alpha-methylacyl-CoA racemase
MSDSLPLAGLKVLDFSSLVPGPLATLILAEAGAEVTKIERPGGGDEMRSYTPRLGDTGANFVVLNRGKRSLTLDLKDRATVDALVGSIHECDIVVEQFRPGVMDRLGLGYQRLAGCHPGLIYCSITGYGQTGPQAGTAAHDLNYVAGSGLVDLVGVDGTPVLPHVLVADIGGGAYPAVINILLAVIERQRSGRGRHLDIAMADGVLPFLYWGLAQGSAAGAWPRRGAELITGGSPRYNLYATSDGRYLAAAPLEERFWQAFCAIVGLRDELRDELSDPAATTAALREIIARSSSEEWSRRFEGTDACCSIVRTLEEAMQDSHFAARGSFDRRVGLEGADGELPALPLPLVATLRRPEQALTAPALREPGVAVDSYVRQ